MADNPPAFAVEAIEAAVLVGAGNIARCDRSTDDATARLLDSIPGTVFTTGDNTYAVGSLAEFNDCYEPGWGRHKARTRPSPGDREYRTEGAAGYFEYFGEAAGSPGNGYYSYDLSDWHIVVLNSSVPMEPGSPQEQWLRGDLAENRSQCTLAYWHHPRFSSYSTSVRPEVKPLWDALYDAGAEVVVNGHYRIYERFGPQTPDEEADPRFGIRQIIVGTGGNGTDAIGTPRPNSEVREPRVFGVLKLTLEPGGYRWEFVAADGGTFTDAGIGTCHGRPGSAPVAAVTISPAIDTVIVDSTVQLTAVATDEQGDSVPDVTMTWSSLDTLTAAVSATGLVAGLAIATARIVATAADVSDTATVVVAPVPVASVSIAPTTAEVETGRTAQLVATTRDAAGEVLLGRTIDWTTSDASIATVSSGGLVTAVRAGSATITATSEGKAATATVTVIRTGHYVTPSGTGDGDGSIARPWSLETALRGGSGRVQPGDTIWLRGGTYRGAFRSSLTGAPGRPIVVRQYPGERAVLEHVGSGDMTLGVDGDWSVFWGFEIMNPDPVRSSSSTESGQRPHGVVNAGSHTKYINLVVHDAGVAFYTYTREFDVEVTGSIFYNNGWQGPTRGHGHALYVKSDIGPVLLRDNVMFNQFGWGVHAYTNSGSGKLVNIQVVGNVSFNNGTLSTNSTAANILVGGHDFATGDVVANNLTYFSPNTGGRNVHVGYNSELNGEVAIRDNQFVGGDPVLEVGFWDRLTASGNTLVGTRRMVILHDESTSGYTWSSTRQYRDPLTLSWAFGGALRPWLLWQNLTGLGLSDLVTGGRPSGTQVFVRPNPYESDRGTIVVYNWNGPGSVAADLSSVLEPGDRYEVHNVQNLFGDPVASGTYSGGPIPLPTSGVAPPTPIGLSSSQSPRTGPQFDVFVVTGR